ncbi:hypothetical protein NEOC84_000695|nr:hypothetical protein [Neochlamydia sp. AcF84]
MEDAHCPFNIIGCEDIYLFSYSLENCFTFAGMFSSRFPFSLKFNSLSSCSISAGKAVSWLPLK